MTDLVAALRSHGIVAPETMVRACDLEGVPYTVGATILEGESAGGRNIFGHDGVSTGGTYTKGAAVTKASYLAYRGWMRAASGRRQGVGPCQCTSAQYQDTADALGGCWDPLANMRSGFRGMGSLIKAYGVQQGARRYNGSGPQAETYGRRFTARHTTWVSRLAGTAPTTATKAVPTAPDPSKGEIDMSLIDRELHPGRNEGSIIVPTGTASGAQGIGDAYVSVRAAGGVRGYVWFQRSADSDGPAPGAGDPLEVSARSAARPWKRVPSGTEFLEYRLDCVGPGGLTVEAFPK